MGSSPTSFLNLPTELHIQICNYFTLPSLTVFDIRSRSASQPLITSYSTLRSLSLTHSSLLYPARVALYLHPCLLRVDSQERFLNTIKNNAELRKIVKFLDVWECERLGWKRHRKESIELLFLCPHIRNVWFDGLNSSEVDAYLHPLHFPTFQHNLTHLTIRGNHSQLRFNRVSSHFRQLHALRYLSLWNLQPEEWLDLPFHKRENVVWEHSLTALEFHNCDLHSKEILELFNSKKGIRDLKIFRDKRCKEQWIEYFRFLKDKTPSILETLVVEDSFQSGVDLGIDFLQWIKIVTVANPNEFLKVTVQDDNGVLARAELQKQLRGVLDTIHLRHITTQRVCLQVLHHDSKSFDTKSWDRRSLDGEWVLVGKEEDM